MGRLETDDGHEVEVYEGEPEDVPRQVDGTQDSEV